MRGTVLADRRLLSALILVMLISWLVYLVTSASAKATYTYEVARTYGSYVREVETIHNKNLNQISVVSTPSFRVS